MHEKIDMLVDTGASHSFVSLSLVKALGIPVKDV